MGQSELFEDHARTKRCSKCKEIKPLTAFQRNSRAASGVDAACKTCRNAMVGVWRDKNKDDISARQRQGRWDDPAQEMLNGARKRAKRDGVPCTIGVDDIVVPAVCPALGIPLRVNRSGKGPRPNSPSLDKITPSLGYVPGNVCVISWRANAIKRDATLAEVRGVMEYMERGLSTRLLFE